MGRLHSPGTRQLQERAELALLLLVRGASTAKVGEQFGVSGRTVERVMLDVVPDDYRAAKAARSQMSHTHGTQGRYNKLGCRCLACSTAVAEVHRQMRLRRQPPEHGTESAYGNHGCRCEPCRAAGSRANRRRYLKAAG